MRLAGHVGVVTGAGRGIGREIATSLAAEGMSLMLLARTGTQVRAVADELAQRFPAQMLPAAIDVSDPAAVGRVVAHAEQYLGPVDLLVNAAGRIETTERLFWEADPAEMWAVVETNLRGPLLMTRALLPAMLQRGHGRVVTLASRARGATHTGTYTGYALSKRAVSALTESLAAPLAGTGVVAVDVLPGLVRTAMTLGMPVWSDVTEWDAASVVAGVVVEVAAGGYDHLHGTMLDAPALAAAR